MAQLCLWTKIRTKQWLVWGVLSFQCMPAGFLCPKCDNFACLHTRQDQNELHPKRWFFLAKSASSVSRSQAHSAKRKRIGWSVGFNSWTNWTLYGVIPFQKPYAIFAHILQHYHDFQSNVAIFPSVVQAYTQPYSISGRIKLIICQIRHALSVTIHEISTSWKKNFRWRTRYYLSYLYYI